MCSYICIGLLFAGMAPATSPALPPLRISEFSPALHAKVQAIYQRAKRNPKDGSAAGRLGMMFHAYLQFESAANCYRIAHSLQPAEEKWSYYLGLVTSELGQHEQ